MLGSLADFRRRLLAWYTRHRRDLPWRLPLDARADRWLDPYHVLVSEAMLQQTTVSAVVPYFLRFIERFPTLQALADAEEQDVLRLWQGLGYYSRARNLQKAARQIVTEHDGRVPDTVEGLLALPGVGRYTAGATASIAYDRRAPILDGNVMRVLCRLDRIVSDPRAKPTQDALWQRAEEILPRKRIGDFNSALMELGATVCTPRSPQCLICPVRSHCQAADAGVQEQIPAPRKAKPTPLRHRAVLCIRHGERWLIEQRPATGRWAGLWQFVTLEANGAPLTAKSIATRLAVRTTRPRHIGTTRHALTHRRYTFDVYLCQATDDAITGADPHRRWVTEVELDRYPLPRPHVTIAKMLREHR